MPITRQELFRSLGVVKDGPTLDKWTHDAYKQEEERRWKNNSRLTTSFHASSYPGAEKSCGRKALYKLMNFPDPEPISPRGIGVMGVGKAVEEQIVDKWAKMGILLGPQPPDQLRIEFKDLWLSGYGDAVLNLMPEYNYVLPVEIKTKKNKVIEYMKVGGQSYDEAHYYQLQAYILWCVRNHKEMGWDKLGLKPANGGTIYYVSREDPRNTHEFFVDLDRDVAFNAAVRLQAWRQNFLWDELPKRPKEWKWTEEPCKWCPFKKNVCKPDYVAGIVKLSESIGVEFAKAHTSSYNVEDIQKKVRERWEIQQLKLF
jgi:hypothetical protein